MKKRPREKLKMEERWGVSTGGEKQSEERQMRRGETGGVER